MRLQYFPVNYNISHKGIRNFDNTLSLTPDEANDFLNPADVDKEMNFKDFALYTKEQLKYFFELNKAKVYKWFNKEREIEQIYSRIQMSDYDKEEGRKLIALDTKKVEKLFKQDKYFYIIPFSDDILSDKFINYLKTNQDINAPTVVFEEDENGPVVNFIDGRHRFSVLRDIGMPEIPFALDEESAKIAEKYDIIRR